MLSQDTLGTLGARAVAQNHVGGRAIENRRVTQEAGGKARLKKAAPNYTEQRKQKGGPRAGAFLLLADVLGHHCLDLW